MLKQKTLIERIKEIQIEADALIDRRVEELRAETNFSIPPPVLRRELEGKAWGCPCKQAAALLEKKQ
ncbi:MULTISPECIES: hypothetical protein [Bradyrhizobium]|uniref:Uncharacterized protein n=1 Tax=Bradyrhizobium barranii subsp. barranii TaxID=2823807 RepID=A0A7Z0QHV4_9BRAD|nr:MULTISPECIES: hypothetical protein [Bradyrhizobium]MCP1779536.1 hypothetical protein [Bradyrhizobium japonicum]MCP1859357.1 hypothetical protein [Bradyrhizobium japonicum]MCP1957469.1 hypothetical protein [Bradyrhizobium japonicum]MCW2323155.1 hypothetical protein [Bradyrhizobium japonicum]UGX98434.1 hypothetical protein G6321_00026270 [Bradyrhizobium barranii subsp. barranii]